MTVLLRTTPHARMTFYKGAEPFEGVYMDEGLTILHPTPILADSNGDWPEIYLDDDGTLVTTKIEKVLHS